MALEECALSELLAALRTGDGIDLIRDAVRLVFQELIDTEAASVIGAQPYGLAGEPVAGEATK